MVAVVAPHTGAWIEIDIKGFVLSVVHVAPHTGAWIEIASATGLPLSPRVAPHTGAWIEMRIAPRGSYRPASLPTRERGLKLTCFGLEQ